MRANLDAPRRPAGLRARARRADRTAGQARGPAADARGAQPRATPTCAASRTRSLPPARPPSRSAAAGWPGRRSAPLARWSTPWSTVRARHEPRSRTHGRDPPAHPGSRRCRRRSCGRRVWRRPSSAGPIYVKRDDLTGFGVAGNKARALEFLAGRRRGTRVRRAGRRRQSQLELLRRRGDGCLHRRVWTCDLLFTRPCTRGPVGEHRAGQGVRRAAALRRGRHARRARRRGGRPRRDARRRRAADRTPCRGAARHRVGAAGLRLCRTGARRPVRSRRHQPRGCRRGHRVRWHPGWAGGRPGRLRSALAGPRRIGEPAAGRRGGPGPPRGSRLCASCLGPWPSRRPPTSTSATAVVPGSAWPPTNDRMSAVLALRHEGLLLDHYYGAKAMTLLRAVLADGAPTPVVFWHTGGVAAALGGTRRGRSAVTGSTDASGPPRGSAAPELVDSGFALENADAPFLHDGLNLADIAHVLDLLATRHHPGRPRPATCSPAARGPRRPTPRTSPTTREFGEPYNSRERFFVERLGDVAGWLHAGRPRREAARIALRLYVRRQLLELVDEVAVFGSATRPTLAAPARRHADARPDLPAAGAAVDVRPLRAVVRLPGGPRRRPAARRVRTWVNRSPGGAGCVNGTRLLDDRAFVARRAGLRRRHRAHPGRDVADRRADPRARDARPACCRPRASWPRTWRSGRAASSTSWTWTTATPGRAS